ncbi:P-loop containing nucleoside triphosphate hydrolase [Paenibacillus sp. 32O-W]|uniref:AAA family ATPase n=1 Tax=Paenibacillus sp. 32O-W TaxID=1695218 RepID=UPI00072126C0|nr:AAA family ATPase [Paenibacillus sp. 32O-W]ALS28817.1 P-loop containing nucleoside triphosphate hydrolase [Paenibacillus sp. 32O-W]
MLHFLRLTVENFGPYKGKQQIEFSSNHGVTIIWGNNGLGKTTLLNVFRYALFGKVQGRGAKSHSLKQIANWESYDEGEYGFKVVLKMNNDGTEYELTRQFVVRDGISKPDKDSDYKEEVFLKRGGSILSNEEKDHVLKSLMPEQVSRFFLFDGELLQEYEELLIDENSTGAKIKGAIETILGVPVLTNGLTDTNEAVKEYSKRLTKVAQKNQDTQLLGNALEAKQTELKSHEDELENLRKKLAELTTERHDLEEEMKQTEKVRDWLNEKRRLEETVERKKEARSAKLIEMKELTKNAWQGMLSQRIQKVLLQLEDEIKIYEDKKSKHVISQQLIEELKKGCETGKCPICEQGLANHALQLIKEKTANYNAGFAALTEFEENKLIELQGRRAQLKKLNVEELRVQVVAIENVLADITVELSDLEQRLSDLDKNIREAGDISRASSVASELARCLQKIDNTENGIREEQELIIKVKDEIKRIEEKLKQAASDDELISAERKREACEKIKRIFERGVELYRDNLKQKVEKDASEIFVSISNQPEYNKLQINDNYGLAIVHQSGRIVEIRSAGYEHLVALSLIGALHKNAPLQGPIIMDSPFGRLDPEHKRKITAALPNLAEQVLLLVYSGEIDEQLARRLLGSNLKNEYKLFSKTAFNTQIVKG